MWDLKAFYNFILGALAASINVSESRIYNNRNWKLPSFHLVKTYEFGYIIGEKSNQNDVSNDWSSMYPNHDFII